MERRLSDFTTLRLGGPARRFFEATSESEMIAVARQCDGERSPLLVLAGGSNVVVADAGFSGTVLRVATRGVARSGAAVRVAAGEDWDAFVASCVAGGLSGVECLSGIPGSVGATPIQNVGAYGQEVASVVSLVRVWDRVDGRIEEMEPRSCGFGYRDSVFKRTPGRWVVLSVDFSLSASGVSAPIAYAELARSLGVSVGDVAPLDAVRAAVLSLRAGKGMVLDPEDPDTVSAGSFFTNPILSADEFSALVSRAGEAPPSWPEADGHVKTSAAWLIERAGFTKGYGDPAAIAISTKHTLALTNRGRGTTSALVALAREIALGVHDRFGVQLSPEPVFVGHDW